MVHGRLHTARHSTPLTVMSGAPAAPKRAASSSTSSAPGRSMPPAPEARPQDVQTNTVTASATVFACSLCSLADIAAAETPPPEADEKAGDYPQRCLHRERGSRKARRQLGRNGSGRMLGEMRCTPHMWSDD